MSRKYQNAVVVGAGFGGIASAIRLRALGLNVTLVDKLDKLGGRAQAFEHQGYRHDAGPTVITAPYLIDELFSLGGKHTHNMVDIVPLAPWYRYVFQDGQSFDYSGQQSLMQAQLEAIQPGAYADYQALLKASHDIFDIGFEQLAHVPFTQVQDMVKQIPALVKLRADRTVYQFVSRYMKHPRLREIFSVHPLLVGGNPFETTAIYSLIHALEDKWGIHFCMGGTGELVFQLKQLMHSMGIDIRLNTQVTSVKTNNGQVSQLVLNEKGYEDTIAADCLVWNGDPYYLYQHCLPKSDVAISNQLRMQFAKYSMGLFVLFFGTDRQYPDMAHHTIWLADRYKALLKEIFHGDALSDDFSLYLHRPTATDARFAPKGHDSFYCLAPVPNLKAGIDWDEAGPRLQARIIKALEETIMPGLSSHIQAPFYMCPKDFKGTYLSRHGAGFNIAPHLTQSAYFRYHNRDPLIKGLYLTGAGTHPGAGLPGVISSAKVVESLVKSDLSEQHSVIVPNSPIVESPKPADPALQVVDLAAIKPVLNQEATEVDTAKRVSEPECMI